MSSKYEKGKKIENISDFENSHSLWYKVIFGADERTKHRSFLESWQYRTLNKFVQRGWVYEAKLIQKEESLKQS